MNRWYLLDDEASPAADNMAWDEFLLERAERVGGAPVLRLYSFDPSAVSIGYHQRATAVLDIAALRRSGIDLVRRITGGRALLHDGELTYAVAAPVGVAGFGPGLAGTFLPIARAVTSALRSIGVDATVESGRTVERALAEAVRDGRAARSGDRADTTVRGSPADGPVPDGGGCDTPCLVSVSRYEIVVRGRKIAGSAQRRTRSAFLQHGSILLRPASGRIVEYIGPSRRSLEDRITSIAEERGGEVDTGRVRSALKQAFSSGFSIRWEPLVVSPGECMEIERRAREKREEFASLMGLEVGG